MEVEGSDRLGVASQGSHVTTGSEIIQLDLYRIQQRAWYPVLEREGHGLT